MRRGKRAPQEKLTEKMDSTDISVIILSHMRGSKPICNAILVCKLWYNFFQASLETNYDQSVMIGNPLTVSVAVSRYISNSAMIAHWQVLCRIRNSNVDIFRIVAQRLFTDKCGPVTIQTLDRIRGITREDIIYITGRTIEQICESHTSIFFDPSHYKGHMFSLADRRNSTVKFSFCRQDISALSADSFKELGDFWVQIECAPRHLPWLEEVKLALAAHRFNPKFKLNRMCRKCALAAIELIPDKSNLLGYYIRECAKHPNGIELLRAYRAKFPNGNIIHKYWLKYPMECLIRLGFIRELMNLYPDGMIANDTERILFEFASRNDMEGLQVMFDKLPEFVDAFVRAILRQDFDDVVFEYQKHYYIPQITPEFISFAIRVAQPITIDDMRLGVHSHADALTIYHAATAAGMQVFLRDLTAKFMLEK